MESCGSRTEERDREGGASFFFFFFLFEENLWLRSTDEMRRRNRTEGRSGSVVGLGWVGLGVEEEGEG